MRDIDIRRADLSDATQLAPLLTQLGYATTPDAVLRRLPTLLQRDDYAVFVAERAAQLLGVGAVHLIPAIHADQPFALITALVVHEAARGAGVGRMLVATLESFASQHGCTRIIVTSAHHRAGAHDFYLHLGYDSTGLRFARPVK